MGDDRSARTKQRSLQQAASVIFAIVAIVPLLILAWTLHALGATRSPQAQFALALALGISLLGFWMFRSLLGRMAEVVRTLTVAVEQAGRARRPAVAAASAPGDAPTIVPTASVATGGARTPPVVDAVASTPAAAVTVRTTSTVTPNPLAVSSVRPARPVAGLGTIRELTEVVKTVDALWYREATAHLGRRVQISVANSREPLVGTLGEATPDGLILEQADGPLPIAYGRVTSIDRLS